MLGGSALVVIAACCGEYVGWWGAKRWATAQGCGEVSE